MKPLRPEHHTPRTYEVSHVTTYTYTEPVDAWYGRACLRPRDTPEQVVTAHDIDIDPTPEAFTEHVDLFGNYSHYLDLHTPHTRLVVAKTTRVEVDRPAPDLDALDAWRVADAGPAADAGADPLLTSAFLLPSPLVEATPAVRDYARRVLPEGAPLGRGIADLVTAIHDDFRYAKGVTNVRTTLTELLELRAGVCQDFTHLALGCLRAVGLPARYVSGYLETAPPPGKPKLQGSDASHAWVGVGLPDGTWLDLDPTNDCTADGRYVVTAWGRDFRDVSPLKGVIYTDGGTSCLDVAVDVRRVEPGAQR